MSELQIASEQTKQVFLVLLRILLFCWIAWLVLWLLGSEGTAALGLSQEVCLLSCTASHMTEGMPGGAHMHCGRDLCRWPPSIHARQGERRRLRTVTGGQVTRERRWMRLMMTSQASRAEPL